MQCLSELPFSLKFWSGFSPPVHAPALWARPDITRGTITMSHEPCSLYARAEYSGSAACVQTQNSHGPKNGHGMGNRGAGCGRNGKKYVPEVRHRSSRCRTTPVLNRRQNLLSLATNTCMPESWLLPGSHLAAGGLSQGYLVRLSSWSPAAVVSLNRWDPPKFSLEEEAPIPPSQPLA